MDERIISVAEIKEKANTIIEIPDWSGEGEIRVKVRRISLLSFLEKGLLPNELLGVVHALVTKGMKGYNPYQSESPEELQNFAAVVKAVAKAALVQPTYDEINEVAELTSEQMTAIFVFCTAGVRSLSSFRKAAGTTDAIGSGGEDLQHKTK